MSHPTDEEVRKAYGVISRHLNGRSTGADDDPLLQCLKGEHPTLKSNLVRILKRSCENQVSAKNGELIYYDGRLGEDWARFVAFATVPFI